MEVETPSLLVYQLTPDVAAAAKAGAGDIAAQIQAITPVTTVRGIDLLSHSTGFEKKH